MMREWPSGMNLCIIKEEEKNMTHANSEVYAKLGRLLLENEAIKKTCDELLSKRVINEDRIRYLEDCQDTLENRALTAEKNSQQLETRYASLKQQYEAKCSELEIRVKKSEVETERELSLVEKQATSFESSREKVQEQLVHAEEQVATLKKSKEELEKKLSLLEEELLNTKERNRILETQLLEEEKFIPAEEYLNEELEKPLEDNKEKVIVKNEHLETSTSDSKNGDDDTSPDISCKLSMYGCAEKRMHKRKRIHSGTKYRQSSWKKLKDSHGSSSSSSPKINSFELHPITINSEDSDSSGSEPDKFSGNSAITLKHARKKFVRTISTMRMLDLNNFDLQEVKFAEGSLYQAMKDLAKKGDGDFLNEIILNYVLSRQTEVSLKAEKQNNFACSEKCVAAACKKLISIGQAKIVTNLMLLFYNIVKNRSRYSLPGYASGVMLFAAISKSVSEHKNIRTLCSEIVASHKDISYYLLSLIFQVYPNAIYHADAKNNWIWFQAVIEVVFSEKPKDMPDDEWQDICAVYENVPKLPDLSCESPEQLLGVMMADIENFTDSSYDIICRQFGYALLMLGVHCGKEWTENVLIKNFWFYKDNHSHKLAKNIFTMFSSIEGRLRGLLK